MFLTSKTEASEFVRPAPKKYPNYEVPDFDEESSSFSQTNRHVKAEDHHHQQSQENHKQPIVRPKLPPKDAFTQTNLIQNREIEYFYLPIYDENFEHNIFDRVYYKYAETQYGDINQDLPLSIRSEGLVDETTVLYEIEWYPKLTSKPQSNFFERDELLLIYPKLVLEYIKKNGVLYLGIQKKEE